MRFRFPKSARLTRKSEFLHVKDEGEAYGGRHIVLSVLKHPVEGAEKTRIGLITSRRLGNAVTRNRIRRRLREIIRANRPFMKEGIWLVIIARKSAATAPLAKLQNDWLSLAKRASVLVNDL